MTEKTSECLVELRGNQNYWVPQKRHRLVFVRLDNPVHNTVTLTTMSAHVELSPQKTRQGEKAHDASKGEGK